MRDLAQSLRGTVTIGRNDAKEPAPRPSTGCREDGRFGRVALVARRLIGGARGAAEFHGAMALCQGRALAQPGHMSACGLPSNPDDP